MSDIFSEALLTLQAAAATLPGRPNVSTIHRWRLKGVRGVRLETIVIGGRRYTSREALERFVAATTAAANGETPPVRTMRQHKQSVDRADRELQADGI